MKTAFARNILRLCCLLFLLVAGMAPLAAQQSRRVLFVGNSYTEVNNLPQLIAMVANSVGDELVYSSNTPGGCTFQQHCTNRSMTLIRQGGWDAVVLQEQSQYPSFPQSQVEAEVFPYAARLVDSIYASSPCAEPMFYMTWGRQNGDRNNAQYFPVLGTYEGMDSMLCLRYTYMAETNDASLCPVGRVWRALRQQYPEVNLYQSDESHPSLAGSYAAACAFYVMLFHRDPMLVSYDGGLPEEIAGAIRAVVRAVVYDNLSQWMRPMPQAAFEFDTISTTVVRFTSMAQRASGVQWTFGDGDTLTTEETTVTHNYTDTGSFQVMQVAWRHCMSDTSVQTVRLSYSSPLSLSAAQLQHLTIYPNPATDRLEVQFPSDLLAEGSVRMELVLSDGRMVESTPVMSNHLTLDISTWPSGSGIVRLITSRGVFSRLFIKQ